MIIDYTLNVVNLLHVSITSCDHLQGGFHEGYLTNASKPVNKYKIISSKYVIHNGDRNT